MHSFLSFLSEQSERKIPWEGRRPIGWWKHGDHLTLYHGTHERHIPSMLQHGINKPDPKTGMYSTTPDPHTAHGYASMSGAGGESGFRNGKAVHTPDEQRAVVKMHIPHKWAEKHMDHDLRGNLGDTRGKMQDETKYKEAKKKGIHDSEYYAASEVRFKKAIPARFIVGHMKKKDK